MTTSVPPKAEERLLDEPSFPMVYVTDLLKAFVKAVRAHQLYMSNNPMHARSLEAVEDAVRERALHRAVLFENLQVSPGRRPHRIMITVTLSFRGQRESADEESSDTPRSRVEAAAKAAVTVLDRLMTDHSVALEGAKIVDAFDREFAFIAVQGLGGRETLLLTGSSQIKESAERAAVFAVLDATNRWTDARRPT